MLETDRPIALREAIMACRNGGTVSVVGVYGGFVDKFPMGAVMNRSLTIKTGQCHVHRYMRPLLERIENGEIDPTLRHHPSAAARRCGRGLRHVRQQGGRLRKSRDDRVIAGAPLERSRGGPVVEHDREPLRNPLSSQTSRSGLCEDNLLHVAFRPRHFGRAVVVVSGTTARATIGPASSPSGTKWSTSAPTRFFRS